MTKPKTHEAWGDPDARHVMTDRDRRNLETRQQIKARLELPHHCHRGVNEEGEPVHIWHHHDDDELGHTHEEHKYPRRADGGYTQRWGPAEAERPPLPDGIADRITEIFQSSARNRAEYPWLYVKWRLRLSCGHRIEVDRPRETLEIGPYDIHTPCPKCKADPIVIVAAKPLGPVAERTADGKPVVWQPPPPPRKSPRDRIRELENENASLRALVEAYRDEPPLAPDAPADP